MFRIKLLKRIYQIRYFSLRHSFRAFNIHSHDNRSTLTAILLERKRIYTVQDWIRISMKWKDRGRRGIIRWTRIRKLSCIWLSMRANRLNGEEGLFRLMEYFEHSFKMVFREKFVSVSRNSRTPLSPLFATVTNFLRRWHGIKEISPPSSIRV